MRILLLEDSLSIRHFMTKRLEALGHRVDAVENGQQGFLKATSSQYDLFLCDILMPHWDGFKFMDAARIVCPRMPIIVVSSVTPEDALGERLKDYPNVLAFLEKPVDLKQLEALLDQVKTQEGESVQKRARIVCTLGPSSSSEEVLCEMVLAGMDIARLNFSHGAYEEHEARLKAVRAAEERWARPVAVLVDLCGPKIRLGPVAGGQVDLPTGGRIVLQADPIEGTAERVSTIAPEILPDLRRGDPILIDDGLLRLVVELEGSTEVACRVEVGGVLKSSKGMNLPATSLSMPAITAKDRQDIDWALKHSIDFLALSFVRSADDIRQVREIISGGQRILKIIAKIEKPEAVERIDEIIDAADGIMIARGDLGVEMPASRVPWIQRDIIKRCWHKNKPVITATQMLDTMTYNHRPTRAEVTDVSAAIREGSDAVMLSQETAVGAHPVLVIRTMASIISEEERHAEMAIDQEELRSGDQEINPALTAAASMGDSAVVMVLNYRGDLYRHLSKWNRKTPTLLVTNSIHVARHSCIYRNVVPLIIKDDLRRDEMVFRAIDEAKQRGYMSKGDVCAVLEGERRTQGGIPQVGAFQLVRVEEGSNAPTHEPSCRHEVGRHSGRGMDSG